MTTNDVLSHIRDIFDFSHSQLITIFGLTGTIVTEAELTNFFRKNGEPCFTRMQDIQLASFLNGLIIEKRGKKEGVQPEAELKITNNMIFNKLKIALEFKAEDVLDTLKLVELGMNKHELSTFFRKPEHKHYRECNDQTLNGFLNGLKIKYSTNDINE